MSYTMVPLIYRGADVGPEGRVISVTKEVARSLLQSNSYELPLHLSVELIMELSPPPLTEDQEERRKYLEMVALET